MEVSMKKLKLIASLTLVLFSLQATAFGWGDTGHMTVAQVAFDNLTPAERDRVNELAALIEFEGKDYEFVTSACWMDDIRDSPMFEPLKDWHFITQRYIIDNAVADEPPPPVNAAAIIVWLTNRIKSKDEPDLKKAYYLAELVHLVGDIHQPLHTVTRYTIDEKGGDRGGNFFLLAETARRKNLHSYWDAAGGGFGFRDISRPLNDAGRTKLQKFATSVQNSFPKPGMASEINKLDPMEWAREGKALAISQVYQGIKEHDEPSEAYQTNAQKVSARRIALAGYRLAAILRQAF
jgi:hypothetical protein